jgi:hypothetical protein
MARRDRNRWYKYLYKKGFYNWEIIHTDVFESHSATGLFTPFAGALFHLSRPHHLAPDNLKRLKNLLVIRLLIKALGNKELLRPF